MRQYVSEQGPKKKINNTWMWLTTDWLVKFSFQKVPVLYTLAEGRNGPVIQEIREQPRDLESVRHPVHLRLSSFLALSSPLMDRHASLLLFLPFDHPIVDDLFHVLSALQHYLQYITVYTKSCGFKGKLSVSPLTTWDITFTLSTLKM